MPFSTVYCGRLFSAFLIVLATLFPMMVFGHGGEDHGDQKPKSSANTKGIVSHSARLGEFEVMVKHPAFEPDKPSTGRVFITRFETNEPLKDGGATVELESANGAIFTGTVEAAEQPGTYSVKFPALPEGVYTMRAKLSYKGETDTATFSSVDVKPLVTGGDASTSWVTTGLMGLIFTIVILLLSGLVFLVWRFAAAPRVSEEAISA